MEGRRYQIFTAFQIVAACALVWGLVTWTNPWDVQRYIGTALVLVGIGLIAVARYQLGKSFSISAQARQLVTTGIYSKIRNPIYVSGAVMIVGVILVVHRPILWVAFFVLIILQTLRAQREARVLEAAFGDVYREYRRKTWF